MPTIDDVKAVLKQVKYPGYSRDILSFGMVKDIEVDGPSLSLAIQFSTQTDEVRRQIEEGVRRAVSALPGITSVNIKIRGQEAAQAHRGGKRQIPGVRHTIAVTSGKGGVGKSTISVNLALALNQLGHRVGLIDADIHGPNIPIMIGVRERPAATPDKKVIPVERYGIKLISIGFFLEEGTPVIWRGPMVTQAIQTFLHGTIWGELDYMVIDLPPGTGDAQLTIVQSVPLTGAVVVTTPQDVALLDARKAVSMFNKVGATIFGIVENMSYYLCPHCGERVEIFSYGGGRETSSALGVPFLGEIPIDTEIRVGGDRGVPIMVSSPDSTPAKVFKDIASYIVARTSLLVGLVVS